MMESRAKKKRHFFSDIWRKILALLFAFLAWWAINDSLKSTYTIDNVEVVINNSNPKVWFSKEHRTVSIEVQTSRPHSSISSKSYSLVIDIPENFVLPESSFIYPVALRPSLVKRGMFAPPVESVHPDHLEMRLDVVINKSVPIVVQEKGVLKPGQLCKKTLEVPMVNIQGPSKLVMGIDHVDTEPLEYINGGIEGENVELNLLPPREDIVMGASKVKVNVEIVSVDENEMLTAKYNGLQIRVLKPDNSVFTGHVKGQNTVDVEISGPGKVMEGYSREIPIPYIDLTEVNSEGDRRMPIRLANAPDKTLTKFLLTPAAVDVEIKENSKPMLEKQPAAASPSVQVSDGQETMGVQEDVEK